MNDTIVVFNADHGEDFGEHGETTHGYTCNRQGVHVPLIVKIPGVKPKRIDTPVALLDIVPTLLEAIGEVPGAMQFDGQSLLVPAFAPTRIDAARPFFCSTLLQDETHANFFIRGVRAGTQAYVHDPSRAAARCTTSPTISPSTTTYRTIRTKRERARARSLADAQPDRQLVGRPARAMMRARRRSHASASYARRNTAITSHSTA